MQILHFSFEAVESMQTYNPRFSVLFVFEGGKKVTILLFKLNIV